MLCGFDRSSVYESLFTNQTRPETRNQGRLFKFLIQSLDGQQSCVFPTDVCGKWVHRHCGPTDYCLFWFTIRMALKGDAVDFRSCSCPDCVTSPSITASHWPCRFFRSSKSWCLHPDAEQQQDLEVCLCVCLCVCVILVGMFVWFFVFFLLLLSLLFCWPALRKKVFLYKNSFGFRIRIKITNERWDLGKYDEGRTVQSSVVPGGTW